MEEFAKCFMLMRLPQLSDCSCREDSDNEYANYNRGGAYMLFPGIRTFGRQ